MFRHHRRRRRHRHHFHRHHQHHHHHRRHYHHHPHDHHHRHDDDDDRHRHHHHHHYSHHHNHNFHHYHDDYYIDVIISNMIMFITIFIIVLISKNWPTKHDTEIVDDVSTKIQPLNSRNLLELETPYKLSPSHHCHVCGIIHNYNGDVKKHTNVSKYKKHVPTGALLQYMALASKLSTHVVFFSNSHDAKHDKIGAS